MGSMFFGQYLLSKGAINREALIDAIDRQRGTNLSLVDLAVRDGCLDPKRAEAILTRYRTSDAGLEELCLEYGEIGREKLDELRRIQRSDWVKMGATLVEREGDVTHIPTRVQDVFDVTGAGDTTISVLTLARAAGADLKSAACLANLAAGIVVGKLGTAVASAAELRDAVEHGIGPGSRAPGS